jgi:hypothetical protein
LLNICEANAVTKSRIAEKDTPVKDEESALWPFRREFVERIGVVEVLKGFKDGDEQPAVSKRRFLNGQVSWAAHIHPSL